MQKETLKETNLKKIGIYFLVLAIEALLAGVYLLSIPSDQKNQWLWGFSQSRLSLFFGFLFVFFIFGLGALFSFRNQPKIAKHLQTINRTPLLKNRILNIAYILFFICLGLELTPSYRFRALAPYMERFHPLILYVILFSIQTVMLLTDTNHQKNKKIFKDKAQLLYLSLVILFIQLILWLGISITKIGVMIDEGKGGIWREAGVPLLFSQILFGVLVIIILKLIKPYLKKAPVFVLNIWSKLSRHKTVLISLLIWFFTIFLWTKPPVIVKNFFFPGPYPPENAFYPFADSATWDIFGQLALIGQGFANGGPFADHIGLAGFNAILHLLAGQNYNLIISLQLVLYALFPVILYLLGKYFYDDLAGLLLAWLVTVHQINAFQSSNMINQSNAKSMLTEFPTGLGLLAIALWLFLWLKNNPKKNIPYLLPISGVLAVLTLFRLNTIVLPIALLAGLALFFGKDLKTTSKILLITVIAMSFVLAPWGWRTWKKSGTPFFFMQKPLAVFDKDFRSETTPNHSYSQNEDLGEQHKVTQVTFLRERQLYTKQDIVKQQYKEPNLITLTIDHFTHNLITSTLTLPTTYFFHDLKHIIYEVNPYWEKIEEGPWTGNLSSAENITLLINLAIISVGLSFSWKKWKLAGLIPLAIFFSYNISTALARTSGGRYIVPIQWVVIFYFTIGILEILELVFSKSSYKNTKKTHSLSVNKKSFSYQKGFLYILPFVIFVSSITVIDQATPARYLKKTKDEIFELIIQENLLKSTNLSEEEIISLSAAPTVVAYLGRSLYPRYYPEGEGEATAQKTAYSPEKFPHLGFTFIGPFGTGQAILALDDIPEDFSHAQDIIVIGCPKKETPPSGANIFIDTLIVIITSNNEKTVYINDKTEILKCSPNKN